LLWRIHQCFGFIVATQGKRGASRSSAREKNVWPMGARYEHACYGKTTQTGREAPAVETQFSSFNDRM
jgi:hypothetical protein